jgi:hypothetical protein
MKLKTKSNKKSKARILLDEAYTKGFCAPDTSEEIYTVIDSDNLTADSGTQNPTKKSDDNVRTRDD